MDQCSFTLSDNNLIRSIAGKLRSVQCQCTVLQCACNVQYVSNRMPTQYQCLSTLPIDSANACKQCMSNILAWHSELESAAGTNISWKNLKQDIASLRSVETLLVRTDLYLYWLSCKRHSQREAGHHEFCIASLHLGKLTFPYILPLHIIPSGWSGIFSVIQTNPHTNSREIL